MHTQALNPSEWALFLDIDGTLLDIQAHPQRVTSNFPLNQLLAKLSVQLDGALALVSGRTVEEIDRIFHPQQFPAAGSHGVQFRANDESPTSPNLPKPSAALIHRAEALVANWPGAFVEHKPFGLALHYRQAPAAKPSIHRWAQAECQQQSNFVVIMGKMVCEIAPRQAGKGQAIGRFLAEDRFCSRKPIFIGDDVTDESGFEYVNALNGLSIRVGEDQPSAAHRQLKNVSAVHNWLARVFLRHN